MFCRRCSLDPSLQRPQLLGVFVAGLVVGSNGSGDGRERNACGGRISVSVGSGKSPAAVQEALRQANRAPHHSRASNTGRRRATGNLCALDAGEAGVEEAGHHATGRAAGILVRGRPGAGSAGSGAGYHVDASARTGPPLATPLGRSAGGIGGRDRRGRRHGRDAGAAGHAADASGTGGIGAAGGFARRRTGEGDAPPLA